MGSIIGAECKKCGFATESVTIGGSRLGFKELSRWPVFCKSCRALRSTNIAKEPHLCLDCGSDQIVFYGGVSEQTKRSSGRNAAQWGEFVLPGTPQFCPQCGEDGLVFGEDGRLAMFD